MNAKAAFLRRSLFNPPARLQRASASEQRYQLLGVYGPVEPDDAPFELAVPTYLRTRTWARATYQNEREAAERLAKALHDASRRRERHVGLMPAATSGKRPLAITPQERILRINAIFEQASKGAKSHHRSAPSSVVDSSCP